MIDNNDISVSLIDALHVKLAALGKPDPDWDPKEHPKDAEGKFVKKGHGTFIFGKTKKGVFTSPFNSINSGFTADYELDPGDTVYQSPVGNALIQKASGELTIHGTTPKGQPNTSAMPAGNIVKQLLAEGKLKKIDENPGQEIKANTEAEAKIKLAQKKAPPVQYQIPNGPKITLGKNQVVLQHMSASVAALYTNGNLTTLWSNGKQISILSEDAKSNWNLFLKEHPNQVVADGSKPSVEKINPLENKESVEVVEQVQKAAAAPQTGVPGGFKHPIGGNLIPIPAGGKVMQHKVSADSFLVFDGNGQPTAFVNKNGKVGKVPSNVVLSNYKPYNTGTEPKPNKVTEDALAALKAKLLGTAEPTKETVVAPKQDSVLAVTEQVKQGPTSLVADGVFTHPVSGSIQKNAVKVYQGKKNKNDFLVETSIDVPVLFDSAGKSKIVAKNSPKVQNKSTLFDLVYDKNNPPKTPEPVVESKSEPTPVEETKQPSPVKAVVAEPIQSEVKSEPKPGDVVASDQEFIDAPVGSKVMLGSFSEYEKQPNGKWKNLTTGTLHSATSFNSSSGAYKWANYGPEEQNSVSTEGEVYTLDDLDSIPVGAVMSKEFSSVSFTKKSNGTWTSNLSQTSFEKGAFANYLKAGSAKWELQVLESPKDEQNNDSNSVTNVSTPATVASVSPTIKKPVTKKKSVKTNFQPEKEITTADEANSYVGSMTSWANSNFGLSYAQDKSFYNMSSEEQIDLIADSYDKFKTAEVTIGQVKSSNLSKSLKIQHGKNRNRFAALAQLSLSAQAIKSNDGSMSDEDIQNAIDTASKQKYTYPFFSAETLVGAVSTANKSRLFKNSLGNIGFDYSNATHEDITSYAKANGFEHAAGLSLDDAKTWLGLKLNDPKYGVNDVVALKSFEQKGKFGVLSANVQSLSIKEAKDAAADSNPSVADKAIAAKAAADKLKVTNLSVSYIDGEGQDWNWDDGSFVSDDGEVVSAFDAASKVALGKWKSENEYTIGGLSIFKVNGLNNYLITSNTSIDDLPITKAKQLYASLDLPFSATIKDEEAIKTALKYASGGNQVVAQAVAIHAHKPEWGFKDGQWPFHGTLFADYFKANGLDKDKTAFGLKDESAIDQAISDLSLGGLLPKGNPTVLSKLKALENFRSFLEDSNFPLTPSPEQELSPNVEAFGPATNTFALPWGKEVELPASYTVKVSLGGKHAVSYDENGNPHTYFDEYDDEESAESYWGTADGMNSLHDLAPYKSFVGAGPVAPVKVVVEKPGSVDQETWDLVSKLITNLDAEESQQFLSFSDGFSGLSAYLIEYNLKSKGVTFAEYEALPDNVKTVLDAALKAESGVNDYLLSSKYTQMVKAIAEKIKGGEFLDPGTEIWKSPNGKSWGLPPGSKVYKAMSSHLIVLPSTEAFYESSTGSVQKAPQSLVGKFDKTENLIFETKPKITLEDSKKDGKEFNEKNWNLVGSFDTLDWSNVALPIFGAANEGQAKNAFEIALHEDDSGGSVSELGVGKNTLDMFDGLPSGVKKLAVYAAQEGDLELLQILDYKAAKGHYGIVQASKPTINPDAIYAKAVMTGTTTALYIYDYWSDEMHSAFLKDYKIPYEGYVGGMPNSTKISNKIAELKAGGLSYPGEDKSKDEVGIGIPANLKLTAIPNDLGGMHSKKKWKDQNGNEWMSKAFDSDPNGPMRVDAEHSANVIGRLFGSHQPETRVMVLDGNYSYVQYLAPAKGSLSGKGPDDLTDDLLAQALEEHVIDWVVSNHDTHAENLLISSDGKHIIGIDKGQAFKHFPTDKLAEGYLPPENGAPVWYDQFYSNVRSSLISKERADFVARRVLIRAKKVSTKHEQRYRELLEEGLSKRTSWPDEYPTKEKFIDALVERKRSTFDNFVELYKDLYAKSSYEFDIDVDNLTSYKIEDDIYVAVHPELVAEVSKGGSHGKSLFFATKDLEDSHLLLYTEEDKNNKTVLKGDTKLRKDADALVTAWLKSQTIESQVKETYDPYSVAPTTNHSYLPGNSHAYSYVLNYAKTVNKHVSDGEYNQGTIEGAKGFAVALKTALDDVEEWEKEHPEKVYEDDLFDSKLVTSEQQMAWKNMAKTYLTYFEQTDKAYEQKIKTYDVSGYATTHPFQQVEYIATKDIDTSGKPKIIESWTNNGEQYDKWSDGNYVLNLGATAKVKGTPEGFAQFISEKGAEKKAIALPKVSDKIGQSIGSSQALDEAPEGAVVKGGAGTLYKKQANGKWNSTNSDTVVSSKDFVGPSLTFYKWEEYPLSATPILGNTVSSVAELDEAPTGATIKIPNAVGAAATFVKIDNGKWKNGVTSEDAAIDSVNFETLLGSYVWQVYPGGSELEPEPNTVESGVVNDAGKVLKVYKRKSAGTLGEFDEKTGKLKHAGSGELQDGHTGYQYDVEYGNVSIHYRPWGEPGVAKSQQGLLRFSVKDWDGSTDQVEDVLETLRTFGLDLTAADEESLELHYWRHMYGILQNRNDASSTKYAPVIEHAKTEWEKNPTMSAAEELEMLKKAWAKAFGDNVVENADYLPKFSHVNPLEADSTFGHPYWLRPDFSLSDLKAVYGETLPQHEAGNSSKIGAVVKSGGLFATEERLRKLGSYIQGMSSGADQEHGSASYLFTRQNRSHASASGNFYFHPKVVLRTTNYAYANDNFGEIDNMKNYAAFDLKAASSHSQGGNELMIKHGLSVLDDFAVVRFSDPYGGSSNSQRDDAIKFYSDLGITEIHGIPLNEFFVTSHEEAKKTMAKVWKIALDEEKNK